MASNISFDSQWMTIVLSFLEVQLLSRVSCDRLVAFISDARCYGGSESINRGNDQYQVDFKYEGVRFSSPFVQSVDPTVKSADEQRLAGSIRTLPIRAG
jgi:hypothetical protein